ncbi:MAG: hypothetical protein R3F11_25110 [Verrucomicrobiales bacterium]
MVGGDRFRPELAEGGGTLVSLIVQTRNPNPASLIALTASGGSGCLALYSNPVAPQRFSVARIVSVVGVKSPPLFLEASQPIRRDHRHRFPAFGDYRFAERNDRDLLGFDLARVKGLFELRNDLRTAFDLDEDFLAGGDGGEDLGEGRDFFSGEGGAFPRSGVELLQIIGIVESATLASLPAVRFAVLSWRQAISPSLVR